MGWCDRKGLGRGIFQRGSGEGWFWEFKLRPEGRGGLIEDP